ncbi:MAG: hypothetical protein IIT57_12755, partial [Treponema sp.]|nr:hypothetical protein [Treponema sp.]
HDKAEKMAEVAFCKKMYFGIGQPMKLVQGDGRSLNGLATYGIFGATRGWSEGVFAASLQGAASSGLPPL